MAETLKDRKPEEKEELVHLFLENATKGSPSLSEIASRFGTNLSTIENWRNELLSGADDIIDEYFPEKEDEEKNDIEENDDKDGQKFIETSFDKKVKKRKQKEKEKKDKYFNTIQKKYIKPSLSLSSKQKSIIFFSIGICVIIAGFILISSLFPSSNSLSRTNDNATASDIQISSETDQVDNAKTPVVKETSTPEPTPTPTPAVITLKADKVEIDYGADYDPQSNIESVKRNDADISDYQIESNVNSTVPGDYNVLIYVTEEDGVKTEKSFTVTVNPQPIQESTPIATQESVATNQPQKKPQNISPAKTQAPSTPLPTPAQVQEQDDTPISSGAADGTTYSDQNACEIAADPLRGHTCVWDGQKYTLHY